MTTTLTVSGSELPVPYPLIVLKPASGRTDLTQGITTLDVDGTPVHLVDRGTALSLIAAAARHTSGRSLGVASINLDHLHHFGASRRERRPARTGARSSAVEWLNLVDGAPIVAHVTRVTGARFPKLSGSDLIESVLDDASLHKQCVAILGGMPDVTSALSARIADKWPGIRYAGHWAPSRQDVDDGPASGRIASELRTVGVDILIVCLGKPRQEEWIDRFGSETGAGVLLAFGAVVDFLAGRVKRAPRWVSDMGIEWAWRLMLEPRRLTRRYLVQGPPAYLALRRSGRTRMRTSAVPIVRTSRR